MPALLPLDDAPTWHAYASCREVGGDLWFPEQGETGVEAKQVCSACPVRGDCLDYAVTAYELDGIWGGLSPRQLAAERKRRGMSPYGEGWSPFKWTPAVVVDLPVVAAADELEEEPTDGELADLVDLVALLERDELAGRAA